MFVPIRVSLPQRQPACGVAAGDCLPPGLARVPIRRCWTAASRQPGPSLRELVGDKPLGPIADDSHSPWALWRAGIGRGRRDPARLELRDLGYGAMPEVDR